MTTDDKNKGFGWLGILIVLAILAGSGYLVAKNLNRNAAVDETANWKIYRNEKYGFEFKYPSTLFVATNTDSGVILKELNPKAPPDGTPAIFINVDRNPDHLSLAKYYDGNHVGVVTGPSSGTVIVGGLTGHVFVPTETEVGDVIVIVPLPSGDFLQIADHGQALQRNGIFDQILTTFKFIGIVNPSSWKTYTNEHYGFEIKYPPDWIIETPENTGDSEYSDTKKERLLYLWTQKSLDAAKQIGEGAPNLGLFVITPNPLIDFQNWYKKISSIYDQPLRTININQGLVGFLTGTTHEEADCCASLFIPHPDNKFFVELYNPTLDPVSTEAKIISTFKFIK